MTLGFLGTVGWVIAAILVAAVGVWIFRPIIAGWINRKGGNV